MLLVKDKLAYTKLIYSYPVLIKNTDMEEVTLSAVALSFLALIITVFCFSSILILCIDRGSLVG